MSHSDDDDDDGVRVAPGSNDSIVFPIDTKMISLAHENKVVNRFRQCYVAVLPFGNTPYSVYTSDAMAFDETGCQKLLGTTLYKSFQWLLHLLDQRQLGTPDLRPGVLMGDAKLSEVLKNRHNYRNQIICGTSHFDLQVADEYHAAITKGSSRHAAAAAAAPQGPDPGSTSVSEAVEAAINGYGNMDELFDMASTATTTTDLGEAMDGSSRPKFDIFFVPCYTTIPGRDVGDRKLVGLMMMAFCNDRNWKMTTVMEQTFKMHQDMLQGTQKTDLRLHVDGIVLEKFKDRDAGIGEYSEMFASIAKMLPELLGDSVRYGVNFEGNSDAHGPNVLWGFNVAKAILLKHTREVITQELSVSGATVSPDLVDKHVNDFDGHLNQLLTSDGGFQFRADQGHAAFFYPYGDLIWDSRATNKNLDILKDMRRRGLKYEWFPWVRDREPKMVRYFSAAGSNVDGQQRVSTSDALDHAKIRTSATQSNLVTVDLGGLNAVRAMHERIEPIIQDLRQQLGKAADAFKENPTTGLSLYNKRSANYWQFLRLACSFFERRVGTVATQKPLTDAFKNVLGFLEGFPHKDADVSLARHLTSVYESNRPLLNKLHKFDSELDTMAHHLIYRHHVTRYIHSIADPSNAHIIDIAVKDACRTDDKQPMHLNIAINGPAAASKSFISQHTIKNAVPGTTVLLTSQSTQANAVDQDTSDMVTNSDEEPKYWVDPSGRDFSPETSEPKAKITMGRLQRLVLELVKDKATGETKRVQHLYTNICQGTLLIVANRPPSDPALASRHFIITVPGNSKNGQQGIALIGHKAKMNEKKKKEDRVQQELRGLLPASSGADKPKVTITDLMMPISEDTREGRAIIKDRLQEMMRHGLFFAARKLQQAGVLPPTSVDMSLMLTKTFKAMKAMQVGTLRAMMRPQLVQENLAFLDALNKVMAVPGIMEEVYANGGRFSLSHLLKMTPYLFVTMQHVVLAMSFLMEEFIVPLKLLVGQHVLAWGFGQFGAAWTEIVHHMDLRHKFLDNVQTQGQAEPQPSTSSADAMDLDAPPAPTMSTLEKAFATSTILPIEDLYQAYPHLPWNMVQDSAHRNGGGGGAPTMTTTPGRSTGGGRSNTSTSAAVDTTAAAAAASSSSSLIFDDPTQRLIDLNYIRVPLRKDKLAQVVASTMVPECSQDDVFRYIGQYEGQSIQVNAIASPIKAEWFKTRKSGEYLPRMEKPMQMIKFDVDSCYVCIHLLDHVGHTEKETILKRIVRSLVYRKMKPRTLLLALGTDENYVPQYHRLTITAEEIKRAPEETFRSVDPSFISAEYISLTNKLTTHVTNVLKGTTLPRPPPTNVANAQPLEFHPTVGSFVEQIDVHGDRVARELFDDNKQMQKGAFIEVREDLDDWAARAHFLRNGLPLTREFQWLKNGPGSPAVPLPTPLELIKLHKSDLQSHPKKLKRKQPAAEEENTASKRPRIDLS